MSLAIVVYLVLSWKMVVIYFYRPRVLTFYVLMSLILNIFRGETVMKLNSDIQQGVLKSPPIFSDK